MIGVFDSGSGGLTVLKAIRERLPSSDIAYFGDLKNAPYGGRSREELSRLTVEGIKFLREKGATSIVSACNSVSASLAVSLADVFDLAPTRLVEMVGPTVAHFRETNARIALAATEATVRSGLYQDAFRMIGKEARAVAIPSLAGAIEHGANQAESESIISTAFAGVPRDFDVLILACTHYPLAQDAFAHALGDTVLLFDPAEAVAERVKRQFWPAEVGDGKLAFFLSRDSEVFRAHAKRLFGGKPFSVEVIQ